MDAKSEKSMPEEREKLLDYESRDEDDTVIPPAAPYGSTQQQQLEDHPPSNSFFHYIYVHRKSIPGYGLVHMVRHVKIYALYVLLMMLIAYLLNQLDRYTLPIVTKSAGYDLHYGDLVCMVTHNKTVLHAIDEYDILANITTDMCTNDTKPTDIKHHEDACLNITFEGNGSIYEPCEWAHDGSGLLYQIVAGPVFNNLYPLAGIFTGFLADYGYRTVWLVISLTFWSVITGLTGFIKQFWHLVLLRALLAIGAAGCTPFAVSIIGDYFPADLRGTAISIYYFGIYIGYSLAFAIGNGIVGVLSWRWVFFLSGLVGIAAAPIILFTVKEPKRTKNLKVEKETQDTIKPSFASRLLLLIKTFLFPGMFMLCIAGGIRNAGGYVWAYNTELFFQAQGLTDAQINHFMSWIPLVGGSLGAVFGGFISDLLVKGRSTYVRIWVLIVSQILAAPFAAGALFLPYPWCFISLIPSNLFGEMWIGVTSAIVVDLAPSSIRTGVVAVYLFIITIIGGNFNLIVTPITHGFEKHFSTLTSYRFSLTLSFPGVYALSSILFVFAFLLMRLDLKRKQRLEGQVNSINDGGVPQDGRFNEAEEEDDMDKPV